MNILWLLAVLAPERIAPHPNFGRLDAGEAEALALICSGRIGEYQSLRHGRPDYARTTLSQAALQSDLLPAVADALTFPSPPDAFEQMSRLASEVVSGPRQVVVTVLWASCLAEVDRPDEALAAIDRALEDFVGSNESSEGKRLVEGLLRQQRALRMIDTGRSPKPDAYAALLALNEVEVAALTLSYTNEASTLTAAQAGSLLVEALGESALNTLVDVTGEAVKLPDGSSVSWPDLLVQGPSQVTLRRAWSRSTAFRSFSSEIFRLKYDPAQRIFTSRDGVEERLFASQLNAELLGSPSVRGLRAELATVRALRSNSGSVEQAQLVLRGFRQAHEQRPLARYIRRLQQSGPLEAVRLEAVHVLDAVPPGRYWAGDLRLLAAAADLLTRQEAVRALDAVLECLQQGGPREGRLNERTAPSALRESAWAAVADLAVVAQQQPRAAMALLQQLVETADELGDAGVRRAAGQLHWDEMPAGVIEAWSAQTQAPDGERDLTWVRDLLLESPVAAGDVVPILEESASISQIAQALNYLNAGREGGRAQLLASVQRQAVRVEHLLQEIRTAARGGVMHGGGLELAEVAAGMCLYAGVDALWRPLCAFLLDTAVPRHELDRTLQRLAQEAEKIPEVWRQRLAQRSTALLYAQRPSMWGNADTYPHGSALRLLAAVDALTDVQLVAECARLAGDDDDAQVGQALAVLALLLKKDARTWAVALTLQLSRDARPLVRAEAARALAVAASREEAATQGLLFGRLKELLSESGFNVPYYALRGLDGADFGRVQPLDDLIETLRDEHPHRLIRQQAAALLAAGAAARPYEV